MTNELSKTNFSSEEPALVDIKLDTTEQLAIESPYKYKLPDGSWVSAESKLEAIKKCPFLNQMPLELAEVILEFSNPIINNPTESSTKPEVIASVKDVVIKPKENQPIVTSSKKNEVLNTVETVAAPEIKTLLYEEYLNPEAVLASKQLDTTLKEVNETLLAPKVDSQDSAIEIVVSEKIVNKPVTKEIVSEPVPQTYSMKEVPQPSEVIQDEQTEPIEIDLHAEEKLSVDESIVPYVQETTSELTEMQPLSETETQLLHDVLTIVHEQTETQVEPEAVFEQLIEMLNLPETDFIEIDISPPLALTENYDQLTDTEDSLVAIFESYINDQPVEETVPTIDQIQAKAEDQPLEESLGQLVSLMIEAAPQNETLIANIFELTEIFAATDDETSVIKFDPEMLSKILSLLELIGYANPEKSLLDLVARYDLRFLISAMRYLHELTDPHKRQEFSISNFLKPIVGSVINPLVELLGKTVIRLTTAQ